MNTVKVDLFLSFLQEKDEQNISESKLNINPTVKYSVYKIVYEDDLFISRLKKLVESTV